MAKNELSALLLTQFNPAQHVIHKPKGNGTGAALKIQLRLEPKLSDKGEFFEKTSLKEGGLFLDLAAQVQENGTAKKDAGGNPFFDWQGDGALITAKLGIPDITAILIGIREFRHNRAEVPVYLRGKDQSQTNLITLFHKNPKGGSTIITLTFGDESSILQISKGKDSRRSISLSMSEELILETYLQLALEAFLRVGKK